MSDLYTSFGFDRKASFCLRLAATRHVSQNNPNPDWQQCYNLMLQATSGFKLSLDPVDMSPGYWVIFYHIFCFKQKYIKILFCASIKLF